MPDSQWVSRLRVESAALQHLAFLVASCRIAIELSSPIFAYITLQRPARPSSLKTEIHITSPQQPLNRHPVIRFPALPAHQRPLRRVALDLYWRVAMAAGASERPRRYPQQVAVVSANCDSGT